MNFFENLSESLFCTMEHIGKTQKIKFDKNFLRKILSDEFFWKSLKSLFCTMEHIGKTKKSNSIKIFLENFKRWIFLKISQNPYFALWNILVKPKNQIR